MRYPILLQARSSAWRIHTARKADKAFLAFQKKVFLRDKYTCQFCGFQAKLFQEVVNIDGDYSNNKLSNLATSCCFCEQCFFLESVGMGDYGGGTLIYLPEMEQGELNSFCHVLFCAITNNTGYKTSSQTLYRSFKFRSQVVEDKYGEGSSDPAIFGQLLIDSGITDYQTTQTIFKHLRLLPSRAKFRNQIEKWAQAALDEIAQE
jgi:intracellular multiplication protein IcmJ